MAEHVRVDGVVLPGVEVVEVGHLGRSEGEVEDLEVLGLALPTLGLDRDRVTFLDGPAQQHLTRRPTHLLGDPGHDRVVQQTVAPAERAPPLGDDSMLAVEGDRRRPNEIGVPFDLVDLGRHSGLRDDPAQVLGLEVRHPDRPSLARRP